MPLPKGSAKGFPPYIWAFLIPKAERENKVAMIVIEFCSGVFQTHHFYEFRALIDKNRVSLRKLVVEPC